MRPLTLHLTAVSLATLLVWQAVAQDNTNPWVQPACSEGGNDFFIFANPQSGCLCETKAAVPAGYVQCPGPANGNAYGFSACNPAPNNSSSTCSVQCNRDAELNAKGECLPINIAPGIPQKFSYLSECADEEDSDTPFLVAKPDGGCVCDRKRPTPIGEYCQGPPNSVVFCVSDQKNIAAGKCDFTCKDPKMKKEGKTCVVSSTTPPTGPTDGVEAEACEAHVPLMFAYKDNTCACFETAEDGAPGTLCPNPATGHGKGSCRNTGAAASECFIKCDKNYKLDDTKHLCVPDRVDQTVLTKACARNPPGRFLTAVPGQGCICMPTQTPQWCQAPTGGGKASCFQNADLTVVECRAADCPSGTKPQGNACVPDCPPGTTVQGTSCVPVCAPGTVLEGTTCVPDIIVKLSSECAAGTSLNAGEGGCVCQVQSDRLSCWPPINKKGKGRCTSKRDGSEAACDLLCDAPLKPNPAGSNCV